jgi:hypothetical protein
MKTQIDPKWIRYVFIAGVIATIAGAIDPMEGSVVIAMGSILLTISAYFKNDRYFKIFLIAAIFIIIGVSSVWYVSSFGGFDPKREWWWTLVILPYPIGWLINIMTLIIKAIKKPIPPPDIL